MLVNSAWAGKSRPSAVRSTTECALLPSMSAARPALRASPSVARSVPVQGPAATTTWLTLSSDAGHGAEARTATGVLLLGAEGAGTAPSSSGLSASV